MHLMFEFNLLKSTAGNAFIEPGVKKQQALAFYIQ